MIAVSPIARAFVMWIIFLAAVAVGARAPVGHATDSSDGQRSAKPAPPKKGAIDAAALYTQQCAVCHGAEGKSTMPGVRSFPDGQWRHGTRTEDIAKVIHNGVPSTTMMPFKGKLTSDQIQALAGYVRAFDKKLPPEKRAPKKAAPKKDGQSGKG